MIRSLLLVLVALLLASPAHAMTAASIPTKFSIPWGNAAGGSFIRSIPTASQIGVQNGAASLTDGFPPLTFTPVGAGGVPPFGQDFNGIFNQITAWNRWQNAGGIVVYDGTFQTAVGGYPKGAMIGSAVTGLVWLSLTDNNVTDPDTGGAGWVQFGGGASTIASATTTDLGTLPQSYLAISGSTNISSFGTSMSPGFKIVRFASVLNLVQSASLLMPTGATITTAAGDTALVQCVSTGNYIVVAYQRADGTPLALGTGQVQTANIAAGAVTTAKIANNAVTNALLAQMGATTIKGNASTSTANAADLTGTQVAQTPGIAPPGLITGLTLSNDSGTPASVIDVATGYATAINTGVPTLMHLSSAFTKSVTTGWSLGSGGGCSDTGTIANPSSIHFFLIERPDTGVNDILCSASATSPTLPTNYTLFRRIGSELYQSAALQAFVQDGNTFRWNTATPPTDFSGGGRTKAVLAVSVPSGIRVNGIFLPIFFGNNANFDAILYDGVNTNISVQLASGNQGGTSITIGTVLTQYTNTSAQIQYAQVSINGGTLQTVGWIDPLN